MHPRNAYRRPPDLGALAKRDAKLAKYVTIRDGHASVAWDDPDAQCAVTEALLREDFGVHATLARDRLCPALPNRVNYVLWVEDLVRALHPADGAPLDGVRGIDLGTGSIAVYACLVCARQPRWTMVATDVDAEALEHARQVVEDPANNLPANALALRERITLVHTHGPLLDGVGLADTADPMPTFHFTMLNPPFYASEAERAASSAAKRMPRVWTAGQAAEMYTPGGEAALVQQLLEESLRWREKIAYVAC
ncbi:23S rRNA (adenine(1618)-N(6))-methyltransferase [Malassezia brasiliensis]|uniref:23S rRNA (Adenine(1618)-N(6))-methyltransferase n=1 Tax=Malassezia brasiliensis TaxID=1821822 RepID=A0AAF0DUB7_9BASI|nr:23S rRNA (adenine(1618)-N(6))-methyltransferase [Malassezia brasiliensis]